MALSYVVGEGFKTVADGGTNHIFDVAGSLELPQETITGGLKYNPSAFTISSAIAQIRVAGTSQYIIKVISYDNAGINPVTHLTQTVTLAGRTPLSLTIGTPSVGADRSIEMTLEQLSGTPSEDFSLKLG